MHDPLEQEVRRTITLALAEDHVKSDITSQDCVFPAESTCAELVLKEASLIAGIIFLPWLCEILDPALKLNTYVKEGTECQAGTVLAAVEGQTQAILAGERTTLNLLQHACGIATTTAKYVQAVAGLSCDILDTRKTLPGLRAIQKYAVQVGGGKNHQFDLEDRFLIKNNHISLLQQTSKHPIIEAVLRARILRPQVKIEVEVEDLHSLEEALAAKADLILLDNMPVPLVKDAVKIAAGKAYLEASGGITLSNVRKYAESGVNGISIGALTHSVTAIDMSLRK